LETLEYDTMYELRIESDDILNSSDEPILWRDWIIAFTTEARPIATLQVTVVNAESKAAIENATVSVSGVSNSKMTRDNGTVVFENLTAGVEVNITAYATDYAANYLITTLEVGLNEVTLELEMDVVTEEPTMSITLGPFRNDKGEDIDGATIFLDICGKEFMAITGANGKATFEIKISDIEDCDQDMVTVTFEHEDYPSSSFTIPIEEILAGIEDGEIEIGISDNPGWSPPTKKEKDEDKDSNLMLYMILIIIIIVVVVVVAAVAMRSKKPPEEEYIPPEEEPLPPEPEIEEIPVGVAHPEEPHYPEEDYVPPEEGGPEEVGEEDLEEELPDLDEEEIEEEIPEEEAELPEEDIEEEVPDEEIEEEMPEEEAELPEEDIEEEAPEEEGEPPEEDIEDEVDDDELEFEDDEDLDLEDEDNDLDLDFDEIENL